MKKKVLIVFVFVFVLLFSIGASSVHAEDQKKLSGIINKVRNAGSTNGDYKKIVNNLNYAEKKLYNEWRAKEISKNDKVAEDIINKTGIGYYSKNLEDGTTLEYSAIDEEDLGKSVDANIKVDIQTKIGGESKNHVKAYGNRQYTYKRNIYYYGVLVTVYVHQTKYSISAQGLKLNQVLKTGTYHIYGSITGEVTKRRVTATKVGQYLASDIEWFMTNYPPIWGSMYYRSTADVKIIKWDKNKKNMTVQQRASFHS